MPTKAPVRSFTGNPAEIPPPLRDGAGRRVSYLRLSLTDRCNLNCVYCRGLEGAVREHALALTDDRLVHIAEAFVLLGIRKVRVTGGEPLLRPTVEHIISRIAALPGVDIVAMTTNGVLLRDALPALVDAGLNRVNISLDSLNRGTFRRITGADALDKVLSGIETALRLARLGRIKINTVVIRGVNDTEIAEFVRWALPQPIDLRFIELMPTRLSRWNSERLIREAEIRRHIEAELVPVPSENDSSTARLYRVGRHPGRIGFISPVSHNFCRSCNRFRLTADGRLFGCLFQDEHLDLRPLVEGARDARKTAEAIRTLVESTRFKHRSGMKVHDFKPVMSAVGG